MNLVLQIPINSLGYGIFALSYYKIINDRHKDLHILPIGNPNLSVVSDYMDLIGINKPEFIRQMIGPEDLPNEYVTLGIWHPQQANIIVGSKKYLHTTFETTIIPQYPQCLEIMKTVDKVLTPSKWGTNVLEDHTIETETVVGPASLIDIDCKDINNFGFLKEYLDNKKVLMSSGKWELRKNQMAIINILDNFKDIVLIGLWDNPFVAGLTKPMAYLNDKDWVMSKVLNHNNNLFYIYTKERNVIIMVSYLKSYFDVISLYNLADIFVTASSGEGWDLPLIENMSLGKPCVTTINTAHTQYCNINNSYLVRCRHEIADDGLFFNGNQGSWFPIYNEGYLERELSSAIAEEKENVGTNAYEDVKRICNPDRIFRLLKEYCEF